MQQTLKQNRKEMQESINNQQLETLKFIKVEEFFDNYQNEWNKIGNIKRYNVNSENDSIELCFTNDIGNESWFIIKFPTPNTFRFRFNPKNKNVENYPKANTRTIVMDTFESLSNTLDKVKMEKVTENNQIIEYDIIDHEKNKKSLRIEINLNPYNLKVYKYKNNRDYFEVMSDCFESIYYKKRNIKADKENLTEYSCILARDKKVTSRYVGFGEKGGIELCKNGKQLTYFNFDNMMYNVIYPEATGSMDEREPLYHSNPFFMEFNRNPNEKSVVASFIDNASESFIDVGKLDDRKYLIGTMYGDFDYYFIVSDDCEGVLETFSQFVGKSKLKPKYILGYHQGCYGYESYDQSSWNQKDLKSVVEEYRKYGIPLDGIHVDVDIQENYCTFTMNENKFPEDTFDKLAEKGVKCSTNITPVVSYLNKDYSTFKSGSKNNYFIRDQRKDNDPYYGGGVYYGSNYGTLGHYTDFGNKDARIWWGQQYKKLYERGLQMVWQDMTTPAIPDKFSLGGNQIEGPDGTKYYIGENIDSDWRSLPMDIKITDNFIKRYQGDAELSGRGNNSMNYEGLIRNVYSYNLHKATYHGLDNIWYITEHTFIDIDNVDLNESKKIFNELKNKNVIVKENDENIQLYLLNGNWEEKIQDCNIGNKQGVIEILKQSQKLRERRENVRNFIIGRGGFTGMHRFAGLWTGDNASTWDFMKINIAQVLALGISGQSVSGADIGGFECNNNEEWADPQLLMRWTMLGSFLSWFRNHYNGKPGKKWFQEPFKYSQDWLMNKVPWNQKHLYKAVLPVCRNYIKLRYKFMQLLYDAMFENTLTAKPIARALFLSEDDPALFNDKINYLNDEFTLGNDLLVAPVITQQQSGWDGRRDVYLPVIDGNDYYNNRWYTYQHNKYKLEEAIKGGSTINYDASFKYDWGTMNPDTDKHIDFLVPLFVRAGAIIPTVDVENYIGEKDFNPVTINIYPGPYNTYCMYQDDGISRSSAHKENFDSSAKGEYRETKISHKYTGINKREIKIEWPHNNYKPNENYFYLSILHDPNENINNPISKISVKNQNVNYYQGNVYCLGNGGKELADWLEQCTDIAWYFNNNINISFIKVILPQELNNLSEEDKNNSNMQSITFEIDYTPNS